MGAFISASSIPNRPRRVQTWLRFISGNSSNIRSMGVVMVGMMGVVEVVAAAVEVFGASCRCCGCCCLRASNTMISSPSSSSRQMIVFAVVLDCHDRFWRFLLTFTGGIILAPAVGYTISTTSSSSLSLMCLFLTVLLLLQLLLIAEAGSNGSVRSTTSIVFIVRFNNACGSI